MNLEKVNANILYSKITVVKRWDFFFMLFFTKICLFNGLTECSESSVEWTRLVSSLAA